MALSVEDWPQKQILIDGHSSHFFLNSASETDYENLQADLFEAANIINKQIRAGNYTTVDKQFVMNNVGMFRGIHSPTGSGRGVTNYVFNFNEDISLIFGPATTKAKLLDKEIAIGLEPLKVFGHQFSDDWQYVSSLVLITPILNWTLEQVKQLIDMV